MELTLTQVRSVLAEKLESCVISVASQQLRIHSAEVPADLVACLAHSHSGMRFLRAYKKV